MNEHTAKAIEHICEAVLLVALFAAVTFGAVQCHRIDKEAAMKEVNK